MIRKNSVLLIAAAIALATSATPAAELHVGPGETYTTIQSAIDTATNGDTVIVADGTYMGDGNRNIDFEGKAITVHSENGPENCVIDCEATQQDQHRGFYFHSNETAESRIEGFTVINSWLGAIHTEESSPTINDCILCQSINGAGIDVLTGSNPTITNCLIERNARWGIFCANGSAEITGCRISENGESGIFCINGSVEITGCRIWENSNGGIRCRDGSLTVTASRITSNTTRFSDGGGIDCRSAEITLRGCYITRNRGSKVGGLYLDSGSVATITNTIIAANISASAGGLYLNRSSEAVVANTIFWENVYDPEFGSPVKLSSGENNLTLSYCLVQDGIDAISAGDTDIVQFGPGNIQGDAGLTRDYFHLLADSPCINAGDPAFDASELPTDIDGEPRIDAGRVDMGVDEFIDTDGDGLPDWFEQVASGSATEATPQGNPDSDSFSNEEEYLRGANPAVPSDLYVDPTNGDDGYNGFAADFDGVNGPKRTIQAAIDACQGGQVIVKPGTYTGDGNRDIDFKGKLITVHGVDPLDPTVVASTIIDCQGTETEFHRGFTFHNGENCHSILAGLTIINGTDDHMGAGIHCVSSTPTIRNCVLRNNSIWEGSTFYGGGGIYCNTIVPMVISDCVISNNYALKEGAGMVCVGPVSIIRCTFENNESRYGPSALYARDGNCIIDQCVFARNRVIVGTPDYCLIAGQGANVSLLNSLIYCNEGNSQLINLSAFDCTGDIRNCTFADNIAGGIRVEGSIINCIFWGNLGDIHSEGPTVNYCNIEHGWSGAGGNNMSLDPQFVDAAKADFHLLPGSPCINAGDPNYTPRQNDTDADGRPRVSYKRLDIGAYEFNGSYDLQGDGIMNLADFVLFAPFWMRSDCDSTNSWCDWSDFNADGQVGSDELVLLSDHWLLGVKVPLEGYWAFDEAHGVVASDSSRFAHDGTLTNMDDSDWVEGEVGNALAFDGVDDFVEITGFTGLLGGQSRTVCAWVRMDTPEGVIIAWGPLGASGCRWVFGTTPVGQLWLGIGGGGSIAGTADICDGAWHHVAAVAEDDGSPNINEVKLYVDGLPDVLSWNEADLTINTLAGPDMTIGQYNGAGFLEGTIDEVRIYDRALSPEEIAALVP